jgi:hypothetical protein
MTVETVEVSERELLSITLNDETNTAPDKKEEAQQK